MIGTIRLDPQSGVRRWARTGLTMGIIAGISFIVFELVIAGITGPSAAMPLRAISAIVLGRGALEPSIHVAVAVVVGLIVHFILSAIFGLILGVVIGIIRPLSNNRGMLLLSAVVYGLLLWLINFYVIAPQTFPWFTEANPIVQFFAHTVFYGSVLGLLLGAAWRGDSRTRRSSR